MRSEHRFPDDDFFCDKYQVWYSMRDCNFRVLQKTFDGCVECFQGRVNLRGLRSRPASPPAPPMSNVLFFPALPPEVSPATRRHRALPPEG